MAYKVIIFSRAQQAFIKLPNKKTQHIVAEALRSLKEHPSPTAGIEKLHYPLVGFRRRVGSYRILLDIENNCIFVRDIKHRKSAYQ
ncbi:hypothetical protein COU15_03105 [Candidatus Kaiserbacteria bacterium CG10_big_fil_rev_8_21_14_0_10_45_20]|uniref:Type II toxin-antitoxin system RelE/ParE family toxin n=1 Tax=Candidatus Kaiserbacteria bacterium CG10_big_fil_rev_8_21_14_0_10_45_20 TaxID=1974607 RepID=A0A2H0UEZ6_9BACT|nr:MAG: hypothetical protein COU15_03105 [Candidatus Kaiserbacteria bacterium CG10_big_fil_rev_8_21_14_0_10_45_20]